MLGELELLALQLPPVVQPDDPDRAEIIALRAAISQLITEITIGLADPTLSCKGSAAAPRSRATWGAGRAFCPLTDR